MKNITDLRDHLFATLEALRDKEKPMDIERAKAIASVGQTIINSAVVEVKYLEMTGSRDSTGFIPPAEEEKIPGVPGVRVHRLK